MLIAGILLGTVLQIARITCCDNHLGGGRTTSNDDFDRLRAGQIPLCSIGCCSGAQESALRDRARGQLQQIARIAGVRVLSSIQALAHQANGEIDFLLRRSKYQIRSYLATNFPRLYLQTNESINELFFEIRRHLFAPGEISVESLEKEIWTAVRAYFVQIFPPTFLCVSMGPCRTVSANYSSCLLKNSAKWQTFFGAQPERIASGLARGIAEFRAIEQAIAELHRVVLEIGTNASERCLLDFTALNYCPLCVARNATLSGEPAPQCRPYCRRVMTGCWAAKTQSWDQVIRTLAKNSEQFEEGFNELVERTRSAIAQAVEVQSPSIAKLVLKVCGPLRNGGVVRIEAVVAQSVGRELAVQCPEEFPLKSISMIKAFTGYIGWWERLVEKLCSHSANSVECWDGTKIIR